MKLISFRRFLYAACVVPLAGTWIETLSVIVFTSHILVVPLAGTWIETTEVTVIIRSNRVVPLAGTWIETFVFFTGSSA